MVDAWRRPLQLEFGNTKPRCCRKTEGILGPPTRNMTIIRMERAEMLTKGWSRLGNMSFTEDSAEDGDQPKGGETQEKTFKREELVFSSFLLPSFPLSFSSSFNPSNQPSIRPATYWALNIFQTLNLALDKPEETPSYIEVWNKSTGNDQISRKGGVQGSSVQSPPAPSCLTGVS